MKINLPSIALITSVGTAIAASVYLHNAVSEQKKVLSSEVGPAIENTKLQVGKISSSIEEFYNNEKSQEVSIMKKRTAVLLTMGGIVGGTAIGIAFANYLTNGEVMNKIRNIDSVNITMNINQKVSSAVNTVRDTAEAMKDIAAEAAESI